MFLCVRGADAGLRAESATWWRYPACVCYIIQIYTVCPRLSDTISRTETGCVCEINGRRSDAGTVRDLHERNQFAGGSVTCELKKS